ncbi:MBL fold metallo-hydrolase [Micromonospora sp. CPCC 206061]|uniref:MBL fold metallo-hydrolase n=1 Tax=Micromonospora sp. CPCC 206061 TaxID=3122410 RepID=UPI002FF090B5
MRLIKYTHACVRLERDGGQLLIDPGTWSEDEAFVDASAVLVTHEHADHIDADRLAAARSTNPSLPVYAPAAVAEQLDGVTAVSPGDTFEAAGYQVRVVGGAHAEIFEGLPGCANVGYVIDGVYHPGDSVFVPDVPVETLLVPTSAPWLKLAEALEFVRAVKPRRAFSIHDAMLSERGEQNVDRWLDMKGGTEYARIPVGESVTLA